ncbi:MAG: hypothetical protein P8X57_13045 [Cyclobacteriaceae bacterium]
MINIKGNLVLQSEAGMLNLQGNKEKLILRIEDWNTLDFLLKKHKPLIGKLVGNKNGFIDQTLLLQIGETDVVKVKGGFPRPVNLSAFLRLIKHYAAS